MTLFKRIAFGVVILAIVAVTLDRSSLAIWRWRVQRYYESLRAASESTLSRPPSPSSPVAFSSKRGAWQVPLVSVALCGPRPSVVLVDGNGGLNLQFEPPYLAWSRYVPYLFPRKINQGSDLYPFNDVYFVKVQTSEDRPQGKALPRPVVSIEHGLPF